jgi:hypothetical protein
MILAQERVPHQILTSISAIAAEAFMNNAGYVVKSKLPKDGRCYLVVV